MNITHFDPETAWDDAVAKYKTSGPIHVIFARQSELMEQYLRIEESRMGSAPRIPVDLDSRIDQAHLKARAWWIVEELGEALDALDEANHTKMVEELVDALHFATELLILAEVSPAEVEPPSETCTLETLTALGAPQLLVFTTPIEIRLLFSVVMQLLSMAMWQLRNKPWKQTEILTDKPMFIKRSIGFYRELLGLVQFIAGASLKETAELYLCKSLVNQFRIRSRY